MQKNTAVVVLLIRSVLNWIYLFIFIPIIGITALKSGISETALIILGILLIMLIFSILIQSKNQNYKKSQSHCQIYRIISSFLMLILGLIFHFGVENRNIWGAMVIGINLLINIKLIQIEWRISLSARISDILGNNKEKIKQEMLSFVFFLFLLGGSFSVTNSILSVFIVMGLLQLGTALADPIKILPESTKSQKKMTVLPEIQQKKILRSKSESLLGIMELIFILIPSAFVWYYSFLQASYLGVVLLGIGLGLGLGLLISLPILNAAFAGFCLIIHYVLFLSSEGTATIFNPLLSALALGIIIGDLKTTSKIELNPPKVLYFFLILVECGVFVVADQFQWLARDWDKNQQFIQWLWVLIIGSFIVVLILQRIVVLSSKKEKFQNKSIDQEVQKHYESRFNDTKGKAVALLLLLCYPTLGLSLFYVSDTTVSVKLEQTYYSVDGTPISSITLKPCTAKILLNYDPLSSSPLSVAFDNNTSIRSEKTVRLGGYYYGLGDISLEDAKLWLGNTNDVFSLGMCGGTFTPEDIMDIRNINPAVKFYYMAFATTLFETAASNITAPYWGDSHYPFMVFNDTMNNWTVKYNNGTEAFGVRRSPTSLSAHLMDLGQDDWAKYFAWIYETRAAQFHADGVAIDEVMWRSYWDTELDELRDYDSLDEIIETCYNWLETLNDSTSMEIITQAFWDDAQIYQDGVWGEIAFRSGGQYGDRVDDEKASVWYEEMDWQEIVENLQKIGEANKSYIWAAWYERDNDEALEYALGTYLMGKPAHSNSAVFHPQMIFDGGYPNNLVGYSVANVKEEVEANPEYYDVELGIPLGDMYLVKQGLQQYWRRDYTLGSVLVNPFHAHIF